MSLRDSHPADNIRVEPAWLEGWTRDVLSAAGAAAPAAATAALHIVDANRRGLDSHGVAMLHYYLPMLRSGAIDGRAVPVVVVDRPAAAVVDGQRALGHYVAELAVNVCCDKATAAGCGFVAVRNSNHFGAASCYTELAVRRGCVAIALSNSDAALAPLGALRPVLGTNPLAIAAPGAAPLPPPSLDIASSIAAQGRVVLAARSGSRIPADWAIGPDGRPTEDPARALAGSMLPVGAHKGFGLAFMIDVIVGCLAGSAISPEIPNDLEDPAPQRIGHAFVAVRVEQLAEADAYGESLRRLAAAVHDAARAEETVPFLTPGEREHAVAETRTLAVPIDAGTVQRLRELGAEYGVPFAPPNGGGDRRVRS